MNIIQKGCNAAFLLFKIACPELIVAVQFAIQFNGGFVG